MITAQNKKSRIFQYLSSFTINGITPLFVVDETEATTALSHRDGTQIVIAFPDYSRVGDTDAYNYQTDIMLFVAQPRPEDEQARPKQAQFAELLDLITAIERKLEQDITENGSPLMAGMELSKTTVSPFASKFGSWNGWVLTAGIS